MSDPTDPDDAAGGSAPCMLHDIGPDGAPMDRQQATDVARWRKAERERLLALRAALSVEERARVAVDIGREVDRLLQSRPESIVSVYWPIRAEPDLRSWMHAASDRGLRLALPVAVALGEPLTFREWRPGCRMVRGLWKILYPADGAEVLPTAALAPLVGFDAGCYRLGYGGGFFDRTLAALRPRPLVIGVGYAQTRIPTIFPQPHDVPMDWIVTGSEASRARQA